MLSMGGVWIFSGMAPYILVFILFSLDTVLMLFVRVPVGFQQ